MDQKQIIEKVKNCYYYAYPIGGMYELLYTQVINPDTKQTDFNEFFHTASVATPKTTFIPAPNNDTTYSRAWLDLRNGPVIIEVPNTNERYYSIQLLDMFSETIDNLGKRLYGTKPHRYAIVHTDWVGELEDDLIVVRVQTHFALAFLRVLIGTESELPEVMRIQNNIIISYYQDLLPEPFVLPIYQNDNYRHFLKMVATVLEEVTAADINVEQKAQLKEVLKYDEQMIDLGCNEAMEDIKNGGSSFGEDIHHWRIARKGIGTYGKDYFQRAVVWFKGALANVPEESLYPSTFQDQHGQLLDGENMYSLTFTKADIPPVSQFWSLTMYIFRNGFLVDNPIDRYSIGDRTDNLEYDKDGSLTIYIQSVEPQDKAHLANWLPSPKEKFYLTLRLYGPSNDAIDGKWQPPYVMKEEG